MTDSPLLIIKENINCDNLLNNDRFNLPIDRINPLIDCPISKRLYKEIYSNTCMDRIILAFRNILNITYPNRSHHYYSNIVATQQEHESVQRNVVTILTTQERAQQSYRSINNDKIVDKEEDSKIDIVKID